MAVFIIPINRDCSIVEYFVSLHWIIKKVVSDCVSEQNKRVSILW